MNLAQEARSAYLNCKQDMYEHVTHHKTITVNRASDPIINERINVPSRSMKGLHLLFCEPRVGEVKVFIPDIISVKVVASGVPGKVYRQGMEGRDMQVRRHLGTERGEESNMDGTDIYTGNKLVVFTALWATTNCTAAVFEHKRRRAARDRKKHFR